MITLGIDEVGRGCWAGPLVAAAVVLAAPIAGLKDSKKLSKAQRERLAQQIEATALAIGVGWVWPEAIDSGGISAAVKGAMAQALQQIRNRGDVVYDELIVDGNINYFPDEPTARAVIKADNLFPAVSAASIIAKVARDNYMATLGPTYDGYGFASHVGYGTAAHSAALLRLGVSDIHRKSFKPIKHLLAQNAQAVNS